MSRMDAAEQLGRSFKATVAAHRRLRGRETHYPGEVTDAQYSLLFGLRDTVERPVGELAIFADVSPASGTEMLEGLTAAGLVTRRRSERDRRVVLVSLTPLGRDLVEERRAAIEPRWRAALGDFSEADLRGAIAVLDRVRDFFDELSRERSPEPDGPVEVGRPLAGAAHGETDPG